MHNVSEKEKQQRRGYKNFFNITTYCFNSYKQSIQFQCRGQGASYCCYMVSENLYLHLSSYQSNTGTGSQVSHKHESQSHIIVKLNIDKQGGPRSNLD